MISAIMQERVPVLLDTDIGSDIDDAVALAYLLAQPRCELLGVTTVTGDVARRCALAEVICRAAGKADIPIHAGASQVLLHGPGQPDVPQYEAIGAMHHRIDWPPGTAVNFLRETIRSRPGEITLLTIGPLGNIALLFALDPEIPSLLKGVVSMAGSFFNPAGGPEWNCHADPIAAAMVYAEMFMPHLSVGLDVTTRCRMPADEVRRRFTVPPLDMVLQMAEVWFRNRREMTFHDPLAAALIFNPGLCEYVEGGVAVNIEPGQKSGMTRFAAGDRYGHHRVARKVDSGGFFGELFGVFPGP